MGRASAQTQSHLESIAHARRSRSASARWRANQQHAQCAMQYHLPDRHSVAGWGGADVTNRRALQEHLQSPPAALASTRQRGQISLRLRMGQRAASSQTRTTKPYCTMTIAQPHMAHAGRAPHGVGAARQTRCAPRCQSPANRAPHPNRTSPLAPLGRRSDDRTIHTPNTSLMYRHAAERLSLARSPGNPTK